MSSRNERRKKKKVILEFPKTWQGNGDSSTEPSERVSPFVLGFCVALILILVPFHAGIYWVCKDAPIAASTSCQPALALLEPPKRRRRRRNPFQRIFRKAPPPSPVSTAPALQDPTTCACQLLWQGLERFGIIHQKDPSTRTKSLPAAAAAAAAAHDNANDKASPDFKLKQQYSTAFTPSMIPITSTQKDLIQKLNEQTHALIENFDHRAAQVPWGGKGGPAWFSHKLSKPETDLEALEGGHVYYSYLRIMSWPASLFAHFPFKLCAKGCDSQVALRHTLEWREKYQPWLVSPSAMQENSLGCVYHHGVSPSLQEEDKPNKNQGAHAIVWIRPGFRTRSLEEVAYTRIYMNTLDRAVAASLETSHGRIGKFNVVIDGSNFSWSAVPSLKTTKIFVTMLQDHFPDRLGIVLLTNLGRVGEFVVKLFLPLLTEEVRQKLIILPHDPEQQRLVLETVVGVDNIPVSLGGTDTFQFNAKEYYSHGKKYNSHCTDEQAKEYVTTMPYHA
jgi:hypothetical protein